MKVKFRSKKKIKKFFSFFICLGLILGSSGISPTALAKESYKTLAFDKKLETRSDFEQGEFKNVRIKEEKEGVELGTENGEVGEYITPIVESSFEANYIGLHWKSKDFKEGSIVVAIQSSDDGINFGEWLNTSVELDETRDDKKNEEIFAALVGVENKKFAKAKIGFVGVDGKFSKLNNFTFTFINSGEASKKIDKKISLFSSSTAGTQGILKTSPGGQNLNVVSREEWGADESYRLDRKGKEEWPRSYHGTRKISIHHTAVVGSNGVTDFETNKAGVRAIYYYHAVTQNWGDIGYNALVDGSGNVYEGRYGTHGLSATRTSPSPDQIMTLDVEAGHTLGYNMGSFGVAAMGDFTSFSAPLEQINGLKDTLAFVADSRGIDIQGHSDFRRYDGTWHFDLNNVFGHRDATSTACPGENLYSQVTSIKTAADNYPGILSNLDNFSVEIEGSPIDVANVGIANISFGWVAFPGATKYQYVLERVFGTAGVASDSEPWESAWLNVENSSIRETSGTNIEINGGDLMPNSNYVFYVRGVDSSGNPISNTKHINFFRNSSMSIDLINPVVTIFSPLNNEKVSGTVIISVGATDNVGIKLLELYIDGRKVSSVLSNTLNYSWNTKKVSVGAHIITAKAYDLAGNLGESSISVSR